MTDRAWTTDITFVPTREGWWSLAAVEVLHRRRIVGWSISERIDSRLVVDALEMAIATTARLRPGGPLGSGQPQGTASNFQHFRSGLGSGIRRPTTPSAACP
uniref:DDE-type integrase/transposase/recombinase n=1 Tax=Tautonia marina TaxID=2653855 RepID=UPI0036F3D1FB